eukprot:5907716-Pyramimonas_sp.AAC.1
MNADCREHKERMHEQLVNETAALHKQVRCSPPPEGAVRLSQSRNLGELREAGELRGEFLLRDCASTRLNDERTGG